MRGEATPLPRSFQYNTWIDVKKTRASFRISNTFRIKRRTGRRIHVDTRACTQGGQVKKAGTAAGQLNSWTDIRFQVERAESHHGPRITVRYKYFQR